MMSRCRCLLIMLASMVCMLKITTTAAIGVAEESTALPSQTAPKEHIQKIARPGDLIEPKSAEKLYTFIEELETAGVRLAGKQDLKTLSYTEIARLLALWHISHQRNYYDMDMDRKQQQHESTNAIENGDHDDVDDDVSDKTDDGVDVIDGNADTEESAGGSAMAVHYM